MCGIAGFAGFEDRGLLERMCDVMKHRGPDDFGYYTDKGVGLGNRRLSIIDLKTGKQPIHNEDHSIWVVYNGEIYNFRELRRELEQKGHRFYTNTDTEVIIHQYEEDGERCVEKFRGMFAFALWDSNAKKLFLARDRLGIKPLYYTIQNGRVIFASEMKALLQSKDIKREIDFLGVDSFLSLRYIPAPYTILKGIRKLPAGHFLVYHNGNVEIKEYWDLTFVEEYEPDEDYYIKKLRGLLEDSVKTELMSDVPLGAFLSGGMDSSTVVGLMSKSSEQHVKTFSIGFGIEGYDELEYAAMVAEHFGTEHHEFIVEPKAIEILPAVVWQLDEPLADFAALSLYYVSKMAKRHVKVVLSGEGGDELFGGYPWYMPKPTDRMAHYFRKSPGLMQKAVLKATEFLPDTNKYLGLAKRALRLASLENEERFIDRTSLLDQDLRSKLYSDSFYDGQVKLDEHLKSYFGRTNAKIYLNKLFYFDIKTFLESDILATVDRMSMFNSLETRPPILDHKIVEFASAIPPYLKIKGNTTKYLFRKVMRDLLPEEILSRGKQGFNLPLHVWFKGELEELPSSVLLDDVTKRRGYFKHEFVKKILEKSKNDRRYLTCVSRLMLLELWFRTYLDREDVSTPIKEII